MISTSQRAVEYQDVIQGIDSIEQAFKSVGNRLYSFRGRVIVYIVAWLVKGI